MLSVAASQHSNEVLRQLRVMREQQMLCDVVLSFGHDQFCCHRAVLAANSEYFCALFARHFDARTSVEVVLDDRDDIALSRCFAKLLDFMYSGLFEGNLEEIVTALRLADQYQFSRFVEVCCPVLRQHTNLSNCVSLLSRIFHLPCTLR
eukprot:TRINITY_DN13106_c0_g1_i3.p1 TRINITY_DN13106_c0_g1~~TRINITY_DN13106_c0_g1_i3.p1  ORF type:complete len:149 (-),score=8.17 TRINITY_DN13106_c0_g1_i3:18-464(-)